MYRFNVPKNSTNRILRVQKYEHVLLNYRDYQSIVYFSKSDTTPFCLSMAYQMAYNHCNFKQLYGLQDEVSVHSIIEIMIYTV